MAMVINTNEQATRIRSVYNQNVSNMNAAMTRLATTRKINSAKDGAANWAISEKMRERIRANDQANQNIQNDTALLKTAQEGLGNTLNILETLKERAINSANDANISTDRLKIQAEVSQLVAQIDDNAAKVKFNDRALLNGAGESSATAATTATKRTTTTQAAQSITDISGANAVTATQPQGTHSVYSIQSLYKWDDTNKKYVAIDSSDTLSSIKLANVFDKDGNQLFQDGDKITVSWSDNGEAKHATLNVVVDGTNDTTLEDFQKLFTESNTVGADSFDTSNSKFIDADSALASSTITDPDSKDVKAEDTGFYIIGKDSTHKITDLAISVTRNDGTDADRLAATQSIIEPKAILQSAGTDFTKGSNQVYKVSGSSGGVIGDLGDQTYWTDLKHKSTADSGKEYIYNTHLSSNPGVAAETDITITINGTQSLTFKGNTTIEELNKKFEEAGINVRAHIAEANEVLTYDGETVTKGDSTSTAAYKADQKGLYFIAGEGEVIRSLKITGGTTSGDTSFKIAGADNVLDSTKASGAKIAQSLGIDNDFLTGATTPTTKTTTTDTSDSMLPQGETLQFYVGGESNFGISFSIGKATVENLFNMTGEDFAAKFQNKEGAEEALNLIDDAINRTLVEQTRLGAMEARLGYTSENLTSMNTNLEAANSAYRDADIAKEMTDYMKYSVLSQSSQYMLAQATQNPFSVLQLLQP